MEDFKNKSMQELLPYILGAGGAFIVLIGCFLPFYSILGFSVAFASAGLAFIIVLFGILATGALVVIEFLKKMPLLRWCVVPAGIALLVIFLNMVNSGGIGAGGLSIGAVLMLLGAAAAVAGGVLGFIWKTGGDNGDGGVNNNMNNTTPPDTNTPEQ